MNKIKTVSIFETITKDLDSLLNAKGISINMCPKYFNKELLYEVTVRKGKKNYRIYYPFCPKGMKEFLKNYYKV